MKTRTQTKRDKVDEIMNDFESILQRHAAFLDNLFHDLENNPAFDTEDPKLKAILADLYLEAQNAKEEYEAF